MYIIILNKKTATAKKIVRLFTKIMRTRSINVSMNEECRILKKCYD